MLGDEIILTSYTISNCCRVTYVPSAKVSDESETSLATQASHSSKNPTLIRIN